MEQNIVVVGGGIIGIACSHYLTRAGFRVTLIDRGPIGGACSKSNCGLVCPSHVLPLAEPGAIQSTLKTMWRRDSPLKIRPQLNRSFANWMLKFAGRCNQKDMIQSGHAIAPLLQSSMRLYEELVRDEGLQCHWEKRGLLFVYESEPAWHSYDPANRLLTSEFNEPARKLSRDETVGLEPALRNDVAGAWYFEHDAHLRPEELIQSWRAKLVESGVKMLENVDLAGLKKVDGRVTAVQLSGGQTINCDHVVVATGAKTPLLRDLLGVEIPIQPGKGYSVTVPRTDASPQVPMIFPEHRVAVTPMADRVRLGSIMEFVGYDESISPRRLKLLREGAQRYLNALLPDELSDEWFGWRPMTYDSTPVIGKCPGHLNVHLAVGHNMLGLSMAPVTGKMIAEQISGVGTHLPDEAYSATRFA